MICPECKAEYRSGFTRCADCDVELVSAMVDGQSGANHLLAKRESDGEGGESDEDPFCQFWKGEDPRVFAELRLVLDEAGIPYRKMEMLDHLFNRMKLPEFRLAVPFSMFEKAEQLVAEAYGSVADADNAMHPTEENREEYRKLIAWSTGEKLGKIQHKEPQSVKGYSEEDLSDI